MDFEIKTEQGKGKMISVQPWPPNNKEEAEIFFVDKEGKLVFGRKNRGAGLVISTAAIDKKGDLFGKEDLIGFTIPDDVPADVKAMMKFTLENPNTFTLKKK